MKAPPFVEECGQVVCLQPHPRPEAESIRLIADLEGEKQRTDRARHIGGLVGRLLGRASR
jgi:hypothetical protein